MKISNVREKAFSFLTLFTSTSTLLCCALPAVLVTIAGGATVTSLISIFPWLIPLSRNKEWLFLFAGLLIVLSVIITFYPKGSVACSIAGKGGCDVTRNFTGIMLYISIAMFCTGLFFAYLFIPLLRWLDVKYL